MNRTIQIVLAGAVALLSAHGAASPVRAQDATAGSPGEWMSRYTTARTLGLGGAYVAVADDPLGVLWNPAGLSDMDQNQVRFEHARLFEDASVNGFGFTVPGSRLPSFGITVLSQRSGEFQKTNDMNDDLGSFRDTQTAYLLSASRALSPQMAVGLNLKFVQHAIEEFTAGGLGVDVGAAYQASPTLRLGMAVANLGGPSHRLDAVDESYPTQVRAGLAAALFQGRGLLALQLDHASGPGTRVHAGAEYWIQPVLALRMGVDHDRGTGGFSYRIGPQYQLDYGVADHVLGLSHRVGLSYRFGGFFARSDASPEVFSPTGERSVTRITLNARTKAEPEQWHLELINKGDEVVRRFGGKGQPPSHIQWDGKDETGMPLADGLYRYRLTVSDREGRTLHSPMRAVEILTSGPQGTVPVIPVEPAPDTQSWNQTP